MLFVNVADNLQNDQSSSLPSSLSGSNSLKPEGNYSLPPPRVESVAATGSVHGAKVEELKQSAKNKSNIFIYIKKFYHKLINYKILLVLNIIICCWKVRHCTFEFGVKFGV